MLDLFQAQCYLKVKSFAGCGQKETKIGANTLTRVRFTVLSLPWTLRVNTVRSERRVTLVGTVFGHPCHSSSSPSRLLCVCVQLCIPGVSMHTGVHVNSYVSLGKYVAWNATGSKNKPQAQQIGVFHVLLRVGEENLLTSQWTAVFIVGRTQHTPRSLVWRSSDPGRKLVLVGVALGSQGSAGHSRQAC